MGLMKEGQKQMGIAKKVKTAAKKVKAKKA
jgi:hypothetical protein